MNDKNLIHFDKRTQSEHRAIAVEGGKASGKARAKRKALRESILAALSSGNTQDNMVAALIQKALDGDVRAFESIRDTIGEKPTEKLELDGGVRFSFDGIGGDDISG